MMEWMFAYKIKTVHCQFKEPVQCHGILGKNREIHA